MKKLDFSFPIISVFLVACLLPAETRAETIEGISYQVTVRTSTQLDPAIDGDIVVYTDLTNGDADVYFTDLATGLETLISGALGLQQLQSVDAGLIAYAEQSPTTGASVIQVYDIASGVTAPLATVTGNDTNPTISGSLVAFQGLSSNFDIFVHDLTSAGFITVTNSVANETNPRIDGSLVVYQRTSGLEWSVVVYDLATSSESVIASGLSAQPVPDISGTTVAFMIQSSLGDSDIAVHDLATGTRTIIEAPGDQSRPRVDGELLVYNDLGGPDMDVVLRHLPSGAEQRISAGPGSTDFLSDITAGRVAYTSDASGNFDIWVYEFTVLPDQLTELTNPAECGPNAVLINFDDQPIGFLSGNAYAHLGVSFLDDQWTTPLVVGPLQRGNVATSSEPNSLVNDADTLTPGSAGIPLTIVFDAPVLCAGMFIGNGASAEIDAELTAYDQNGALIGAVFDPVADPTTEFFGVASAVPISRITVDYGNSTLAEEIDDLTFVSAVDIEVAPSAVAFGDVVVGDSTTAIVTLSNTGVADLSVTNLSMASTGGDISIGSSPPLPAVIPPNGTADVVITFAPSSTGPHSDALQIASNDPDEYLVEIALGGNGIVSEPPPIQQIRDLLEFFDFSVTNGTLAGNGAGNSAAGRLGALRNMIEAAADLIEQGALEDACTQLRDIYLRTDGHPRPPDFVTGQDAAVLAARILDLMTSLGCA